MLLALYALQGDPVGTTALADAIGTPLTTALRWIQYLENKGLVRRISDPNDLRRANVYLQTRGFEQMEAYLRGLS